jgi:uncharacterized protein YbjQ (UPF0145 family)
VSDQNFLPPDQAPAADLPVHARERLVEMRTKHFFTSDLSVPEFLLVKEIGFDPLGLVMGSSIYHIKPIVPRISDWSVVGCELDDLTQALYHSRELALGRMDEEAEALGADGVIGVRLEVNLHAWGSNVAEFVAVGTAVRWRTAPGKFRDKRNKPFTSALSGQDFWTLLRAGYRPVGFVMGNCCYYVPAAAVGQLSGTSINGELQGYTHALYDARELAMERLQVEAEELGAEGIVGVTVHEKQHGWRGTRRANSWQGETIEFFVVGTAVVAIQQPLPIPVPRLVLEATP